jgi:hypothetical protein
MHADTLGGINPLPVRTDSGVYLYRGDHSRCRDLDISSLLNNSLKSGTYITLPL